MEELIYGFIAGLAMLYAQHGLNRSDMNEQNKQSLGMSKEMTNYTFQNYESPQARAKALAEAGLSDAAIGQALSGYSGYSGQMVTSAPMQPTNISDIFGSTIDKFLDKSRLGNETDLKNSAINVNKANIKKALSETNLNEQELKLAQATFNQMVSQSEQQTLGMILDNYNKLGDFYIKGQEYQKKQVELRIKKIEEYIKENTKDEEIELIEQEVRLKKQEYRLNEEQIKVLTAQIAYIKAETDALNDMSQVRKKEAAEALWYDTFIENTGMPFDIVKYKTDSLLKVLDSICGIFSIRLGKLRTKKS